MLTQRTIVDQVEIARDGKLQVRFALLVVDDNGNEIASTWHRTAIAPGGDVDAQITLVNAHLMQMGKGTVDDSEISYVKLIAHICWTPAIVAAFARKMPVTL